MNLLDLFLSERLELVIAGRLLFEGAASTGFLEFFNALRRSEGENGDFSLNGVLDIDINFFSVLSMPKGVDLVVLLVFSGKNRLLELSLLLIRNKLLNKERLWRKLECLNVATNHDNLLVSVYRCHLALGRILKDHLSLILDVDHND